MEYRFKCDVNIEHNAWLYKLNMALELPMDYGIYVR